MHVAFAILIKHIRNVLELCIERTADRIDGGNDDDRNAGCDQAVLDGGGARLIFQEPKPQNLSSCVAHITLKRADCE